MQRRTVVIAAEDDGRYTGELFVAGETAAPGIVLLTEVFGRTSPMTAIAERFANDGFAVLIPDLYWEIGDDVTFADDDRRAAGDAFLKIGGSVGHKEYAVAAVKALAAQPECTGKVALVGFGVGGLSAFAAAAEHSADAGVSFYPPILNLAGVEALGAPWQYHYAGADRFARDNLYNDIVGRFAGGNSADIRLYDGAGHGFVVPGRAEYDEDATDHALAATAAFLSGALGGADIHALREPS
jgi:carboxymethylenebutenolidase